MLETNWLDELLPEGAPHPEPSDFLRNNFCMYILSRGQVLIGRLRLTEEEERRLRRAYASVKATLSMGLSHREALSALKYYTTPLLPGPLINLPVLVLTDPVKALRHLEKASHALTGYPQDDRPFREPFLRVLKGIMDNEALEPLDY